MSACLLNSRVALESKVGTLIFVLGFGSSFLSVHDDLMQAKYLLRF